MDDYVPAKKEVTLEFEEGNEVSDELKITNIRKK